MYLSNKIHLSQYNINTGKWYNDHCDDVNHGYICKRRYGDDSTKTPRPPVTVDGHCPLGYTEAGQSHILP